MTINSSILMIIGSFSAGIFSIFEYNLLSTKIAETSQWSTIEAISISEKSGKRGTAIIP